MPCEAEKLRVEGAALTAGLAAGAVLVGSPTVIGSVLAGAALGGAILNWRGAAKALENCLAAHQRHEDAETLRRELDQLKREMEELQRRQPAQ